MLAALVLKHSAITSSPGEASIMFSVDREASLSSECVILRWKVDQIREVYLDGRGVVGSGEERQCGAVPAQHTLHVILRDGWQFDYVLIAPLYSVRGLTIALSVVAALAWLAISVGRPRQSWTTNIIPGLAAALTAINLVNGWASNVEWLGLAALWCIVWGIRLGSRVRFAPLLSQSAHTKSATDDHQRTSPPLRIQREGAEGVRWTNFSQWLKQALRWLGLFASLAGVAIVGALLLILSISAVSLPSIAVLLAPPPENTFSKSNVGFLILTGVLLISAIMTSKLSGSQGERIDFAFVLMLLLPPAVVLILLRGRIWHQDSTFMTGVYLCWLITCLGWAYFHRSRTIVMQHESHTRNQQPPKISFFHSLGLAALIFAVAVTAFYIPMIQRFWVGMDEGFWISQTQQPLWSDFFDSFANRPMVNLGVQLANAFSPQSVDGYLWMAFILRLCTGLFTAGAVLELLPRAKETKAVALVAAILFIANPSEVSRFLAISLPVYHIAVFTFTGAVFLFLYSYRIQRRSLLLLSCIFLGISLLSYETGFPLAALVTLFPWLLRRNRHRLLWAYAWFGTWAVLAARFAVYLWIGGEGTYQALAGSSLSINTLLYNLRVQLLPLFTYFKLTLEALAYFWPWGLAAFLVVIVLLWQATRNVTFTPNSRPYWQGLLIIALLIFMGTVPYFVLAPIIDPTLAANLATFRTQYYSAPAQAAAYAVAIGLVGRRSAKPNLTRIWYCLVPAVLVMSSVMEGLHLQQTSPVLRGVQFDRIAAIFRQVDQLVPNLPSDAAVFFVVHEHMPTPFGGDYPLVALSCARLGVPAYHGSYSPQVGWLPRTSTGYLPANYSNVFSFKNVVAFGITPDNTVTLLNLPTPVPRPGAAEIDPKTQCEFWRATRQHVDILRYAGEYLNLNTSK
jgi:hypothetical protein